MVSLFNDKIVKQNDFYVLNSDASQLIVPKSARVNILKELHDKIGHNGISKTLCRVRERYFWPGMLSFVKKYCKSCHICAINKDNPSPNSAPLVPISTSHLEPFQMVGMDILGPFPTAVNGEKYIVVLQDYFTKWPEAVALESVDSKSIQDWISKDIIPRYGVFNDLITDQGTQFVSCSFKKFCTDLGIHCRITSPYHPMTDGMVERTNRTLLNMLRTYVSENQTDWPDHLSLLLYSYRTAVHESIKVSPAEALQSHRLRLPIDLSVPPTVFSINQSSPSVDLLMERMSKIRAGIRDNAAQSLEKRKKDYNSAKVRKIRDDFKIGDHVYWRKPIVKKGKCPKLSPIWQGPFNVKNKQSDVNMIISDSDNTCITVHVNNLKLCHDVNVPTKRIGTRGRPKKET
jgi:hypothetical protein